MTALRSAAPCLLSATALLALLPAAGSAKTIPVEIRVAKTSGAELTDQIQYTDATTVPTSTSAACFGPGTGGSGDPAPVPGPTALSALVDASRADRDLRPLSVSDHFDFGLAICGIGGHVARGQKSWYLKVNHVNPNLGGDSVRVRRGDELLWYLAPSFPYPDELSLVAPDSADSGRPFTVRVFAYSDSGKRSPVAGARVTGAGQPTGADGRTTVTLGKSSDLVARHAGDIADDTERVCVGGGCPAQEPLTVVGSGERDVIRGTAAPNLVRALGGGDRIDVRGGGRDSVNCGGGRDTVLLGPGDAVRKCEARIRR